MEPLGILYGKNAQKSVKSGMAWPLAGASDRAFTAVRFLDDLSITQGKDEIILVHTLSGVVPEKWRHAKEKLISQPSLAGLPEGVLVMGILNVTPDSFSDGGSYFTPEKAIQRMMEMHDQGADIIDIGAESTRPESTEVPAEEEIARLLPVLKVAQHEGIVVSVDTRHSAVMKMALQEGVALINDVSALAYDEKSADIVASSQKPVVLMHMRGTPQTMTHFSGYGGHVTFQVACELQAAINAAQEKMIPVDRILIDPGIGFAKNTEENIELLQHLSILACLGHRLLIGVSRKSFLGKITHQSLPSERDIATMVATLTSFDLKDTICRVHNVKAAVEARAVWQRLHGM